MSDIDMSTQPDTADEAQVFPLEFGSRQRFTDRSRIVSDWSCPRKRWWNYEWGGRGVVSSNLAMPLFLGSALHDGLAAIATQWQADGSADINTIASTTDRAIFETLASAGAADDSTRLWAHEQAALISGLLRGFYRFRWPQLIAQWPRIVAIEREVELKLGSKLTFMSKPDLLLANDEETVYIEYKSTSTKKDEWVNSWSTAVQLHSSIKAVEATLGIKAQAAVIVGLYKGYCLAPDTPVLTSDLRWVPVGSLKKGDKLGAFEEHTSTHWSRRFFKRQWREASVTRTGRALLPAYKLTFSDGSVVKCSEDHEWLTVLRKENSSGSGVWTKTRDLKARKGLRGGSLVLKVLEPWNDKATECHEAGYLGGILDGEGSIVHHTDKRGFCNSWVAFYQNPGLVLSKSISILKRLGVQFVQLDRKAQLNKVIMIGSRPDFLRLLGICRPVRLLAKFSFDKLGGMSPCKEPIRLIAKEFLGLQEVITLETSTATLIANGIASHNSSYGKQNSPFCYAYARKGAPPFSHDEIRYDYAPGFKRSPAWELPGGLAKWVDEMPEELLAEQFPTTPPIYIKDDLVEAFFKQTLSREMEISLAIQMMAAMQPEEAVDILNVSFPQHWSECSPTWGTGCGYKMLCHSGITDPLAHGWTLRESHHAPEADAHAAQEQDVTKP